MGWLRGKRLFKYSLMSDSGCGWLPGKFAAALPTHTPLIHVLFAFTFFIATSIVLLYPLSKVSSE
jgi:hypothetical protein